MKHMQILNKTMKIKSRILAKTLSVGVLLVLTAGSVHHLNKQQKETSTKSNYVNNTDLLSSYIPSPSMLSESYMKYSTSEGMRNETKRLEELRLIKEEEERLAELARLESIRVEAEKERKHKEELEKERLRRLEEKKNEPKVASRGTDYKSVNKDLGTFNVSWYGSDCYKCSGVTATGFDVKNTITYNGYGVAASDWNVIPPYSIIEVEGYGQYIILDSGGRIKNKSLDLLTTSEAKSNEYGRQHLKVTVLRWGKK